MPKVKDVMRRYVVTVSRDVSADAVTKIMSNNRIGSVVITDGDVPVGIFTSEDVVRLIARGEDPKRVTMGTLPKQEFVTVGPEEDILKATRLIIRHGIKRLPVVKDGRLQGIVTDKELLMAAPELVEVLSEKLKMRAERVAQPHATISGICEQCEGYSDALKNVNGRWWCPDCRN